MSLGCMDEPHSLTSMPEASLIPSNGLIIIFSCADFGESSLAPSYAVYLKFSTCDFRSSTIKTCPSPFLQCSLSIPEQILTTPHTQSEQTLTTPYTQSGQRIRQLICTTICLHTILPEQQSTQIKEYSESQYGSSRTPFRPPFGMLCLSYHRSRT